ncbi:uncharacterized protein LOC134259588 [Saccostrea cucullata]|uniref:uncharacterized protein LOC134259588 n=1 Tax=Saccostrea cuccullata TaxID=36930 RepID=UPI002ED6B1CA
MASEGLFPNTWRYPDDLFPDYEVYLKSQVLGKISIPIDFTQYAWENACFVADDVLGIILTELQKQAEKYFEGLTIDRNFIRQGSARQGLKIESPDEFDAIVPFKIEGLRLQEVHLWDTAGQYLPGQIRLRVMNDEQIGMLPRLQREGVFEVVNGACFLNTKALQEQVFKSLMDKTLYELFLATAKRLEGTPETGRPSEVHVYHVKRGSRPPTMDLTVNVDFQDPSTVYVDFVPALMLGSEMILIPGAIISSPCDIAINFPRFGLMKWINKENADICEKDKELRWRNCSSAYEKFMFDICFMNRERRYIMTSCRIMKALVKRLKEQSNQAAILLTSYHLKTIAMYCVLLLTIPTVIVPSGFHIAGVREALGYFMTFVYLSLEKKCLPDFFLGNENLGKIFPDSHFTKIHVKYNLFEKENPRLVEAAKYCFPEMQNVLYGCYNDNNLNARVISYFRDRILTI